jgi:hypothetical protein
MSLVSFILLRFFLLSSSLYSHVLLLNMTIAKRLLITLAFLTIQMLICFIFLLASILTLMGRIILGGVIRRVVIYFLFILVFGT